MGLIDVVVGVLAKDYGFHRVEGGVAGPRYLIQHGGQT